MHAQADGEFARTLASDLQAARIGGVRSVLVGAGSSADLLRAVARGSWVVIVCSPDSSRLLEQYSSVTFNGFPSIILALVRPCQVPGALQGVKHIDFSSDYPTALMDLMTVLAQVPPDGEARPSEPKNAARPRSHRIIAMAVGGAVFGAAANFLVFSRDVRFGPLGHESLLTAAIAGFVVSGLGWGLVGVLAPKAGSVMRPAVIAAVAGVVLWLIVGGTYADVVSAALLYGAPIAAGIGVLLVRMFRNLKEGSSR